MGSCMSKPRDGGKQGNEEIALARKDEKAESVEKEIQRSSALYDPETGERKPNCCCHRGERLSLVPTLCNTTGINDYKKFAAEQYKIDYDQYRNCYEPRQQEHHQQRNPTRFYNWHAEGTHNAWRNSNRSRGQGASRLNQERSFYASGPADTYRVPNRSRGYQYERQRAAEDKKDQVVPKVTLFLGEGKPTSRQTEKSQKNRCEDDETADIFRTAARMFENNDL